MARRQTHKDDCLRLLGEEYDHVHEYLDEFVKKWPPHIHLEYHRQFRHHAAGVEKCKEKWGFYAERAAMIHIVRDNELYIMSKPFGQMEIEELEYYYERALKYCHPIRKDKL
jgi:hypothetical protein